MKKRIWSAIICVCLLLSIVPVMNLLPANEAHAVTTKHTLDASAITISGNEQKYAAGDTLVIEDYFTIRFRKECKITTESVLTFGDYTPTQYISFNGKSQEEEVNGVKDWGNVIRFKTSGSATIKIWWSVTKVDRTIYLQDSNHATINGTTLTAEAANTGTISELSVAKAGTYYIACSAAVNIYKIEVTETVSGGGDTSCTHTNKKDVAAVPATCETDGTTAGVKCSDCGTVISGCEPVEKLGHNYTSAVTTEADCVNPGVRTYTCQNDNSHTYTEEIPVIAHNYVDGACSVCSAEQPATEEKTYTFTASTDVTVGKDGAAISAGTKYTDGYFTIVGNVTQRVSDSGAVTAIELVKNYAGAVEFKVTGTAVVTVYARSTSADNISTLWLVDANNKQISEQNAKTTVKGSTPEAFTYEVSAGTYKIVCPTNDRNTRITAIEVTETVSGGTDEPTCEHTNVTTTTVNATCTTAGSITTVCDDCDAITSTEPIPATGHTFGTDNKCTVCGATDCDHKWGEGETRIKPTCVRAGTKEYICSECGDHKYEVIPAGHDYTGPNGICVCSGGVLESCGAVNSDAYVHNFTTAALVDSDKFFSITGAMKTTQVTSVVYNGQPLTKAMKMNETDGFRISFTTLTDAVAKEKGYAEGSGILILVTTSRESTKGNATLTTLLINGVKVGVPRDGILVLGVSAGTEYVITKETGENPLYYIEYVPGAKLVNVPEVDQPGEGGDSDDDGMITVTAEIIDEHGHMLSQYTTLAAALAAVKDGQTVCLMEANSENVTVGAQLAVNESFTIHLHAAHSGTVTAADAGVTVTGPNNNEYTVTRTAEAPGDGDTKPDGVAYIDTDKNDAYDQGEKVFKTVSAALEAAAKLVNGENEVYVRLLSDATETYVIIPVGVVLDLNACTLTADYVVGFNGSYLIADRVNSSGAEIGKLFVNKDISLGEEAYIADPEDKTANTVIPIWDNDLKCYVFAKLGINTEHKDNSFADGTNEEGAPAVTFIFKHLCADVTAEKYLADGIADNKLRLVVRLSWTVNDGTAYQDFVYKDSIAADAIDAGNMCFRFEMSNYAELGIDLSTLTATAMIISDTGVIAAGETFTIKLENDEANTEPVE